MFSLRLNNRLGPNWISFRIAKTLSGGLDNFNTQQTIFFAMIGKVKTCDMGYFLSINIYLCLNSHHTSSVIQLSALRNIAANYF